MDMMVWTGVSITAAGLLGLAWCMFKANAARRAKLAGHELVRHLRTLVVVNVASFSVAAVGLAIVIVGILL